MTTITIIINHHLNHNCRVKSLHADAMGDLYDGVPRISLHEVVPPLFLRKLKAFGWWVGFDLTGSRQQCIF